MVALPPDTLIELASPTFPVSQKQGSGEFTRRAAGHSWNSAANEPVQCSVLVLLQSTELLVYSAAIHFSEWQYHCSMPLVRL